MKSVSLDQWRSYFASADSDIFDIIEHAIVVAATDFPKEFKLRRDGIAEKLFSCLLNRCFGCEKVELPVPNEENEIENCKQGVARDGASKESKVDSGSEDNEVRKVNPISNYTFGEAEALTDEIERESETVAEVLRIRGILRNREDESDSVLFESLRRLELMQLCVNILKSTEIGKAVNPLRKHGSNKISKLARTLIDGWKHLVDAWVKVETVPVPGSEGGTPDSVNPSVVVNAEEELEEGLPSPPLDEGAFFVSAPGTMELSQFFDGMDDDGNIRKSAPSNKNRDNSRKPSLDKRNLPEFNETAVTAKDNKSKLMKKNETAAMRPNKPVAADTGRVRPHGLDTQRKANFMEPKLPQKFENGTVPKRTLIAQQDKPKTSDDAAKLEATKRKLQERYQQAENAKRQRTIQVMDVSDLPKQGAANRNTHFKPGNQNRQWGHHMRK